MAPRTASKSPMRILCLQLRQKYLEISNGVSSHQNISKWMTKSSFNKIWFYGLRRYRYFFLDVIDFHGLRIFWQYYILSLVSNSFISVPKSLYRKIITNIFFRIFRILCELHFETNSLKCHADSDPFKSKREEFRYEDYAKSNPTRILICFYLSSV